MPAHVRCLDPDRSTAECSVEPAHHTLVCIRGRDLLGEPRPPGPLANLGGLRGRGIQVGQVEIDLDAGQVGQHRGEVPVQ
jgi:hypothetical protein